MTPAAAECVACSGSGFERLTHCHVGGPFPCSVCAGVGRTQDCDDCNGTGNAVYRDGCPACFSTGKRAAR